MRTYTHGLVGYLFYLRGTRRQKVLAVAGGMVPDLVLGIGYVPHILEPVAPVPIVVEAHRLLHHGSLHGVTEAMHSLVVVGALTAVALLLIRPAAPFLVGMLAHGALDLLTHGRAAYNHLYPFAVDPVLSPISYTDRWFIVVEHMVLAAVLAWLIARWRSARPSGPSAPAGGPCRGTMVREGEGG